MKKLSIKVIGILTVVLTILSFSNILADAKIYNEDITYNEDTEYLMSETYVYIDPKYNAKDILAIVNDNDSSKESYYKSNENKNCLYHDYIWTATKETETQIINQLLIPKLERNDITDAILDYDITLKKETYPEFTSIVVTPKEGDDGFGTIYYDHVLDSLEDNKKRFNSEPVINENTKAITFSFENSDTTPAKIFEYITEIQLYAGGEEYVKVTTKDNKKPVSLSSIIENDKTDSASASDSVSASTSSSEETSSSSPITTIIIVIASVVILGIIIFIIYKNRNKR